ncbi:SH3 domain-containing protein [Ideonella sp. DXS29W]|uniref:SH3 domain-containing protein n=1 Tax=Ideonella lacteola TaxID=2984193 RepID=A0ABU9BQP7_9BURK
MHLSHRLAAGLAGLSVLLPLSLRAQEQAPNQSPASSAGLPDVQAAPAPASPPVANMAPSEPSGKLLARVRVIGPYLDMRSGPGRGYPIFYAAEREEWVVIELRHTDWFKVRTSRGQAGWVSREQMRQTVTEDGVPFELADPTLQAFLDRRFDLGVGYGATAKTSFTRVWAGWRFSDTMSLDLNGADVQGQSYTIALWSASLLSEPWSDKRFSPFMGVGVGHYNYVPNKNVVNRKEADGNMGIFTLGGRYYLASRVALRIDYSRYAAFTSDKNYRNFQAGTIGLSLHF